MCSMILKETLEFYHRNKSTVHCTMLDATEAFDRVGYCKLLYVCYWKRTYTTILLHLYLFHFTKIAWNGTCSSSFHVLDGVRQGAILSPVFFCAYFDTLLSNLNADGMGCHISSLLVGALAYADDLVLYIARTTWVACCEFAAMSTLHSLKSFSMPANLNVYVANPTAQPNTQHKLLAYILTVISNWSQLIEFVQ